jgi:HEAT repeat protein
LPFSRFIRFKNADAPMAERLQFSSMLIVMVFLGCGEAPQQSADKRTQQPKPAVKTSPAALPGNQKPAAPTDDSDLAQRQPAEKPAIAPADTAQPNGAATSAAITTNEAILAALETCKLPRFVPPEINAQLATKPRSMIDSDWEILRDDAQPERAHELLTSPSVEARLQALQVIFYRWGARELTPPFPEIRNRISDPNVEVACTAIKFFRKPSEESVAAIPALLWATLCEDERRSEAFYTLEELGPATEPALPYFIGLASLPPEQAKEEWSPIHRGIDGIGAIGPAAISAESVLIPHLKGYGAEADASEALAKLGAVDALLAHAKEEGEQVSELVIASLGELPESDPRVVEYLTDLAKNSPFASHRGAANLVLAKIQPDTTDALGTIAAGLADAVPKARADAAQALGALDPQPEEAIPLLIRTLQDEDPSVRNAALEALCRSKVTSQERLDALLAVAAEGDEYTCFTVIGALNENDDYRPRLLKLMADAKQPEAIRAFVIASFAYLPPDRWQPHQAMFERIIRAKTQPESLRGAAAVALFFQEQKDRQVIETLLAGARQKASPHVRRESLEMLQKCDPQDAAPTFLALLKEADPSFQLIVLKSLRKIGPAAAPAVPELISLVEKGEDETAFQATLVLGGIGAEAKPALPALMKAAKVQNDQLALPFGAIGALALISAELDDDPAPVVEVLIESLERDRFRRQSVGLLGHIGPRAAKAVPSLLQLLPSEYDNLHFIVTQAISKIGPAANAAVPTMKKLLDDENDIVYAHALDTLVAISPDPEEFVRLLLTMLSQEKNEQRRSHLIDSLGKMGSKAKAAVPELIKMFDEGDDRRHLGIIYALGDIGPDAAAAIEPILNRMKLETGEDHMLRNAGHRALQAIAPDDPRVKKLFKPSAEELEIQ